MIRDNFAYSTIFTFALTFVLALALSWVYGYTKPRVEINQQQELASTTLKALGIDGGSDPVTAFQKQFGKRPNEADELEETQLNGETVKVLQFEGMGLWDHISGILAVNADVSRIIGLAILEQKETPGLGGRISEEAFLQQFTGEEIAQTMARKMPVAEGGDSDHGNSSFDGVSGATLTSTYFQKIINDAIMKLRGGA